MSKTFPQPIALRKLLGPSFVILALGLGSGEVILWPFLTANHGLGLAWGALIGITFQYFINMEIERYALVKGESVFVGLHRLWKWSAYWFILSTFIGFALPGIIAASAQVFAALFGFSDFKYLAILLLLSIGVILSMSKTVYVLLERITKTVILVGVPFLIVLVFMLAGSADWSALGAGLVGVGDGYFGLPEGIVLATFLAAFAYSGAGGNLNLTQSIYIKEKGYGMGVYSQKIAGLFRSNVAQKVELQGPSYVVDDTFVARFKSWWKIMNKEHLLVFWFVGFVAICMLMLLSFVTTHGLENNAEGIQFVINEGRAISSLLGPWVGAAFLFVAGVMLFQTQLGILDSTSRIMAENAALRIMDRKKTSTIKLSRLYFIFIWSQIAFGVLLFLLNIYEPKTLIVLGAVLNAVAMFVHIGLVQWLNQKSLEKVFRPATWRKAVLLLIFLFFGVFSFITLLTI